MITHRSLGLAEAKAALDAMLTHALADADRPVAVAVVDGSGDLLAYAKMDGTTSIAKHLARRKAVTAARMGRDSGEVGEWVSRLGVPIADFGDPEFIGFQGGICIRVDGAVVGGVGVSGRAADEDEAIARIGEAAMRL